MDATDLLEAIGGDGPFQVIMILATQSIRIVTLWSLFFMTFGIYQPPWTCLDDVSEARSRHMNNSMDQSRFSTDPSVFGQMPNTIELTNISGNDLPGHRNLLDNVNTILSTFSMVSNFSDIIRTNNVSFSNSSSGFNHINNTESDSCEHFEACAAVSFDAGSSTIVSEFHLLCDGQWAAPIIICLQMVGYVFGSFLGGQAGESIGRKRAMYLSTAIMSCTTIGSTFSPRWEIFAALRFVIGVTNGSIFTLCVVYCVEFLGQKGRTAFKIIPVFGLGAATSSVLVFFIRDWKILNIVIGVVSGLLCIPVFWVPESIRWLFVNGKIDTIKKVAQKISRINTKQDFSQTAHFDELTERANSLSTTSERKYGYLDLFKGLRQSRITISITTVWMIRYLVHFMLNFGVKAFSGDFYVNLLIYSFCEVPVFIIVAPAVRFMGNRHSACLFFFISCAASVAIVIVQLTVSSDTSGTVITYLALSAKFFISSVNQVVLVYTNELFPTVIRSVGVGIANGVGMIGGAAAPFLIPNTPSALPINFSIVSVLQFLACILLLTLPETKAQRLKDFAKGEGNEPAAQPAIPDRNEERENRI